MASSVPVKKMKRSKSLNSLIESEYRFESECDKSCAGDDSGVQADGCSSLERKVDKLSDICCEQTRVLAALAVQVRGRGAGADADADADTDQPARAGKAHNNIADREQPGESGARSLLDAIEARPSLERRVGDALADLLQSEDLKQRIVSTTEATIKEQIKSLFSSEVSVMFVPVMERAHHQLLKHVTRAVTAAFADLEESTACNAEALRETAQSLQAALQRQEGLLLRACADGRLADAVARIAEKVIERELKQWREEILSAVMLASEYESAGVDSPAPSCASASPEVLVSTELSSVDRMMITAEVTKLIREGDLNGGLTRALLAADLRVLAAAVRAAPPPRPGPGAPPRPGLLSPPVLLSLLQQLATDMLQDTPLKCSYMEYALQSLQPADAATRAHLPFVVGELHRHLSAFLHKYPHHTQASRISAIIDTARSLL